MTSFLQGYFIALERKIYLSYTCNWVNKLVAIISKKVNSGLTSVDSGPRIINI